MIFYFHPPNLARTGLLCCASGPSSMDRFKQIETFVTVAAKGSLSAAALAEGVAPAIIGRRIDALEERLGVKLLVRTTPQDHTDLRRLGVSRGLSAHHSRHAERRGERVGGRREGERPFARFRPGRLPDAGTLRRWCRLSPSRIPMCSITLDPSDRLVDLVNEGFDCAVQLGELPDSSLVSLKLGENRRVCVASPAYLSRRGAPHSLADLAQHNCLALGRERQPAARLDVPARRQSGIDQGIGHDGMLGQARCCTSGASKATASRGARGGKSARTSRRAGLVSVLDEFAAPPIGIHAVFPQRRHLRAARTAVPGFSQAYVQPSRLLGLTPGGVSRAWHTDTAGGFRYANRP